MTCVSSLSAPMTRSLVTPPHCTPQQTQRTHSAGAIVGQRLRRWPTIAPAQCARRVSLRRGTIVVWWQTLYWAASFKSFYLFDTSCYANGYIWCASGGLIPVRRHTSLPSIAPPLEQHLILEEIPHASQSLLQASSYSVELRRFHSGFHSRDIINLFVQHVGLTIYLLTIYLFREI